MLHIVILYYILIVQITFIIHTLLNRSNEKSNFYRNFLHQYS
jgi:hypothetical protein